ncbi:MAG: squalene synthase HpnC [Chlorobi bacterium]|nr:squalene synthase HpnC [Chlorobiota bacterium]
MELIEPTNRAATSLQTEQWGVAEAFAHCQRVARQHYENFPVASVLIPKSLRPHVAAIYAFSRAADDIADEGNFSVEERLRRLDEWEHHLDDACSGKPTGPIFTALAATISQHSIPAQLLRDLLTAFRMDARNGGYHTMDDLLFYCRHSANPIGRLVLHLFGLATPERVQLADMICTGLQLVNFWQDISVDLPGGRVNIPQEIMQSFDCPPEQLRSGKFTPNCQRMMQHLTEHAEEFLREGSKLLPIIPHRRLRWELTLTVRGGLAIAQKIRQAGFNTLAARPTLGIMDKVRLVVGRTRREHKSRNYRPSP